MPEAFLRFRLEKRTHRFESGGQAQTPLEAKRVGMNPGSVVEYLDGKDLLLGFCLGAEVKSKLPIMNAAGRKESLATKKVLFSQSTSLSVTSSREDVLGHLAHVAEKKDTEASQLDTAELWELLEEEGPDREWHLKELCEYVFSGSSPEHQSVLFRALLKDRYRFQRKGEQFVIKTAEQVAEAVQREQVEAQRDAERAAVKGWLKRVWEGDRSPYSGPYDAVVGEWLERIRNTAIFGEDSSHYQHVMRFLKELDGRDPNVAFAFMVRLGEWDLDQNIELLANETPTEFSEEVLEEARQAGERLEEVLAEENRVDLTEWVCHSIDDPDTTEIDDALAWKPIEQGYELAIHIADASAFLLPRFEALEKEIRYRATSVYLPDLKVRMVPENLSDDVMSLRAGVLRPAFTFLARIDFEGKLMSADILTSKICVRERLDYNLADERVAQGEPYWREFAAVADKLKAQREANGAVNLPFPRMNIELHGKKIVLVPDERDSASQRIVSEMMILANRIAAEYLFENGLPAVYRSQKAPEPPIEMRAEWRPHHLYEARRSFSRSAQGFEPAFHSGLGLNHYVQATSPIRRYRDLVLQRQMKHHLLMGEILYSLEELEEIVTATSSPVSLAEKMERNRKSFYLHKLLLSQRGKEVEAVILAASPERYTLQLCETLRELDVPTGGGTLKAPGEIVKVKILSVYPRDRVLKVSAPS